MIKDLISSEFYSDLLRGNDFFKNHNYFRILVHYDGDGTSAAIIMAKLLVREGKKFHLGFIKDLSNEGFLKRVEEEPNLPTIIVDAGSDQTKFLDKNARNIMVLDHHFFSENNQEVLNINARNYGIDGTREACGATMAFIFALSVKEENKDLLPFMISGCKADKQDMGGFRGINSKLIEAYGKNIERKHTLNLQGENILDAIVYSTQPFFSSLTGSQENTKKALEKMGISVDTKLDDLKRDEIEKLSKFLSYKLSVQGCQSEAFSYLETDELFFDIGLNATELTKIIESNSKNGDNNIPVEYFMGNTGLKAEMLSNNRKYETKLIDYILRSMKSMTVEKNVQFFYAPGSELAGPIAGQLMLYLANQERPIFGFNVGDAQTFVSSRGTRRMIEKGLNLSTVMKECSEKVGGSGGGHDIAAGGSIPRGMERQFIEFADQMVGLQLNRVYS